MGTVVVVVVGVLVIAASVTFIDEAIEMWRAPDALTRVNLTGPVGGVGIPLLLVANLVWSIYGGDVWWVVLMKTVVALFGVLVVSSVGSFVLGRAIHAEQLRRGQGATLEKARKR